MLYLHDFNLCCCGDQLGEAGLQALPAHADVLALLSQQLDEGCQQLQVAGWSHLNNSSVHSDPTFQVMMKLHHKQHIYSFQSWWDEDRDKKRHSGCLWQHCALACAFV